MRSAKLNKAAVIAAGLTLGLPLIIGMSNIIATIASRSAFAAIAMGAMWSISAVFIFVELSKEQEKTP